MSKGIIAACAVLVAVGGVLGGGYKWTQEHPEVVKTITALISPSYYDDKDDEKSQRTYQVNTKILFKDGRWMEVKASRIGRDGSHDGCQFGTEHMVIARDDKSIGDSLRLNPGEQEGVSTSGVKGYIRLIFDDSGSCTVVFSQRIAPFVTAAL